MKSLENHSTIMDLYSFQYPPRPVPSDAHRPLRYYFHNLDHDHIVASKVLSFQKEGVPPNQVTSIPRHSAASVFSTTSTSTTQLSGTPKTITSALVVLDRSKFLVK
ncbi:hypothetical protein BGZ83_009264 [Gryganskiella cystojenkinii]|nr:hypothetical protein BGZ83_009264 [Gryganskiella cystojenkinii]